MTSSSSSTAFARVPRSRSRSRTPACAPAASWPRPSMPRIRPDRRGLEKWTVDTNDRLLAGPVRSSVMHRQRRYILTMSAVAGSIAIWAALSCLDLLVPFFCMRSTMTAIAPIALDHVALWVADRDAISALLCGHLGMHEIERTDSFTLVGADARRGKLTLFAAEGPRDPGVLERVVLRVNDLDAALARLPDGLDV